MPEGVPLDGITASEHTALLPSWACVGERRLAHIARVVALLETWAVAMAIDGTERQAWRDAGAWHDALRDADEASLRGETGDVVSPVGLLHGPAAARRLEMLGELRADVVEAVRWHTVGSSRWARVGKALYMADFLEPGRPFMQTDRAFLASRVPEAFDAVFRQVVRLRLEWALREGKGLHDETVAMWNAVRCVT
jgi:2-amino-4-hydroxy-6-hydroxymethyldihydropteridine diphosphokinase